MARKKRSDEEMIMDFFCTAELNAVEAVYKIVTGVMRHRSIPAVPNARLTRRCASAPKQQPPDETVTARGV